MPKESTSYCKACGEPENNAAITGDFLPYLCSDCKTLEAVMPLSTIERINDMSYEEMLRVNRYTPAGEGLFAHRESGEYFAKVMNRRRAQVGPAAHTAASKSIGW